MTTAVFDSRDPERVVLRMISLAGARYCQVLTMRGIVVAAVCLALAVLLLVFPSWEIAIWIGQQINRLLAPDRNVPHLWELRAGIFFTVVGLGIVIYKWWDRS